MRLYIINVCISVDFIKIERNVFCLTLWVSIYQFGFQNETNLILKNVLKLAYFKFWLK
jgi:hypothetical protein